MLKKSLLLWLCIALSIFSNIAGAKPKACIVNPSYDIVVAKDFIQVINETHNLIITPSGSIILNGNSPNTKPTIQTEAKIFQNYLRKQLPDFENKAYLLLDEVRDAFAKAINEKLGNKSELLESLNNLHKQLRNLLNKSIVTKDNVTYFYYKPFNLIKKEGEDIGKKTFYKIIGSSIVNFNVFKNYAVIKKIAKAEWKEQKIILKSFDDHICDLLTEIDDQYNHLIIGIS